MHHKVEVLAQEVDLPQLADLYRYLSSENLEIDPEVLACIWRQFTAGRDTILVCRQDSRIVAACTVYILPNFSWGGRPFAVVENVVTHPDVRGKGYGKAVMIAAEQMATAQGCYKIMLMSGVTRTAAHQFYRSLGYDDSQKAGFQKRFV